MPLTLADLSARMKDIDFCMLVSRAQDGSMAGRPMSNNKQVDYEGDSYFFTDDDTRMVADIDRDPSVGLAFAGSAGIKGMVGAPGLFIHVEGEASIVRDKHSFAERWDKNLDRWFPEGIDTPGLVMIKVSARRVHYWDGEDEGEVDLPDTAR